MKEKLFNILVVMVCVFILGFLLINKQLIYGTISYALLMWVNNLIPAMFPFFIISDILINYNITDYIPKKIKEFCKWLFNITDNCLSILILSMVSGFPSNARNARSMYDKGMITAMDANHILMFSHFSNPVFVLTTVGLFFFKYERAGVILLITHYLSNFLVGIIFRGSFSHDSKGGVFDKRKRLSLGNVFIDAIKKSVDTVLSICGIVTVFLVLSTIVVDIGNFNSYNGMLIKGLFEITIGIEALSGLALSLRMKMIIASFFLAFGGLSVHVQVLSQLTDTDIKYHYFFVGRLIQSIIAIFLTFIMCVCLGI